MDKKLLEETLAKYGLNHDAFVLENFEKIAQKTIKTNDLFNLTAITDIDVFREKMILDSALGIINLSLSNKKVIDIGTGAGFPGLILYVLNPEMDLTLLDATKKKIDYLKDVSSEFNYSLSFANDRSEDYARKHPEEYDYVFVRAVASANILLEITSPLLKVGGTLVLLKGPGAKEELDNAKHTLKELGLEVTNIYEYVLPETGTLLLPPAILRLIDHNAS